MNSPVSFLTNLRQLRSLKRSEMFFWVETNNALKRIRGNFSLHNNRIENVIKQLVHTSDMKHLGSLESTQEARLRLDQLLRFFRALQASRVLHISMKHADVWTNC